MIFGTKFREMSVLPGTVPACALGDYRYLRSSLRAW